MKSWYSFVSRYLARPSSLECLQALVLNGAPPVAKRTVADDSLGARTGHSEIIPCAISYKLMAAAALLLNGRAGHRSVGTKHAAIASLRLQQRFAVGALVKILARIRRHDFRPVVATAWACQHGL